MKLQFLLFGAFSVAASVAVADVSATSSIEQRIVAAAANYQQYCALCHGRDRQGYANDHAPSLQSRSLMTSGAREMVYATAYGRLGTPMAAYLDELGGPMTMAEIRDLVQWLRSKVEVEPYEYANEVVAGDSEFGAKVYLEHCSSCHGVSGEGGTGTALGNPAMLALTTDRFLRFAIEHGRDGTEMAAFGETLSTHEIDSVVAFLRSRATGWTLEKPILRTPPEAENYVLNPDSPTVESELEDGLYISSAELFEALQQKRRIVLLDTRAMSQWQIANIEGSIPLPYYSHYGSMERFAASLPKDGTMIVTYCACPRAAAEHVNASIRELGFTNTAVLWEGIRGWIALGYPVYRGTTVGSSKPTVPGPTENVAHKGR